ncbi:MAG: AMP-binding protein [Clostridiales bacterium]|nr:AMP-binding protein [Clostridiales bacterium]
MENKTKYVKQKNNEIVHSNFTFESLFDVIHNQGDRVFCEYLSNFKIAEVKYADFKPYARKMATHLSGQIQATPNSYVGLYMENCVNWVATFWALLMLGYKPLLLNVRLPLAVNQKVLTMTDCSVIVTDESRANTQLGATVVSVESGVGISSSVIAEQEYKPTQWANEIALTSTATSLNVKVCAYTGKEFCHQILNAKSIIAQNRMIKSHYKGRLKLLAFLPFYHIFGLIATYFWFATFGRTFVFLTDYSSNTVLKTVKKHEVTHIFAVPLLWHSLHREITKQVGAMDEKTQKKFAKGVKLSLAMQNLCPALGLKHAKRLFAEVQDKTFGPSVKFMISGGSYVSYDALKLINALGYPLFNGYGATEIGITSVELRTRPKFRMLASVGKPFRSVQYRIDDDVLYVKGQSLSSRITTADGYVETNHDEWYNTRDIAHSDAKGYYYVDGRRDEVFIGVNGEKINPDLVEKELKLDTVERYSVLGLEIEGNQKLCLVVEVEEFRGVRLKKIVNDVKSNLERLAALGYHVDNVFVSRERICNPNAIKVSRRALLKQIENNQVTLIPFSELNVERFADETLLSRETCDEVKKIMADILNKDVSEISDNAHFVFELGGTSLDYCTLLVELKKAYGVEFDLQSQGCCSALEFSNYIVSHIQ